MTNVISVATGVIVRGDRYLLTQRGTRSDFPFAWESPGGKIRPGEGTLAALIRELREEIGWADYEVEHPPLAIVTLHPGEVCPHGVMITFYRCVAPPEFVARPCDPNVLGLGWFTRAEMDRLELVPGNARLLYYLDRYGS